MWLLIAITIGLLGLEASGLINIEEAKDLALAILGPLIAVTGTVFGFYYGGHRRG